MNRRGFLKNVSGLLLFPYFLIKKQLYATNIGSLKSYYCYTICRNSLNVPLPNIVMIPENCIDDKPNIKTIWDLANYIIAIERKTLKKYKDFTYYRFGKMDEYWIIYSIIDCNPSIESHTRYLLSRKWGERDIIQLIEVLHANLRV